MAASCAALWINRTGVYRTRDRLARRNVCSWPRERWPRPPLAFNDTERAVLQQILDSERFVDLAPPAIYAMLLDEGRYYGSMRTMYRRLALNGQNGERRNQ